MNIHIADLRAWAHRKQGSLAMLSFGIGCIALGYCAATISYQRYAAVQNVQQAVAIQHIVEAYGDALASKDDALAAKDQVIATLSQQTTAAAKTANSAAKTASTAAKTATSAVKAAQAHVGHR